VKQFRFRILYPGASTEDTLLFEYPNTDAPELFIHQYTLATPETGTPLVLTAIGPEPGINVWAGIVQRIYRLDRAD